ncbi:MAG: endolytic transglycosylase MltG [Clostridiales bacterium]|nr:endolytic transglycosylase MltG [Clostridiales bacterium]
MNDDNLQNDPGHRRKVDNFRLNISDDEFGGFPNSAAAGGDEGQVIHSYSDPKAAQQAENAAKEAEERAAKAHKLRNREKRRGNRFFYRMVWLIMVFITAGLLAQFAITGINDMLAVGRESVAVTVEIPANATTAQVADVLNKAGIIRDKAFFQLYSKMTKADGHYTNGSFQIKTNMDYEAIITKLQSSANRVDIVKVTFPEGVNAIEIANLLEKNGVCTAKEALSAMNSSKLDSDFTMISSISNPKERYYKLEGYLFPDTYNFYKNEDPVQVVRKMVSNCDGKLTKEIRNKISAKKMTIDQTMTLASMIQAEAADKADMYKISSVFHNRLASGGTDDLLRLRSDPTIYYPYRNKASVPSNIRDTFKSRYNTYTIQGLPPGPICSPGADAIDAALNPADTKYCYFCHDSKGNPYYAVTIAQHEANLKKAGLK